jgi:hypothetical protein
MLCRIGWLRMSTDRAADNPVFGISIDRDVVRRILAARHDPTPEPAGPPGLTVLGHAKDSLWIVGP